MAYELTHEVVSWLRNPNGVVSRCKSRWSCLSAAQWAAKNTMRPNEIVAYVAPICRNED